MMPIIGLAGNLLLFFDFSLDSENVAGTQDACFCVTVWPKFLSRLLPNVLICTFLLGIHDSLRLHACCFGLLSHCQIFTYCKILLLGHLKLFTEVNFKIKEILIFVHIPIQISYEED
jgi:hypothetical protein